MWYYKGEIINSPKAMNIGDLQYNKSLFRNSEKMKELGIKPYSEVRPDSRYFSVGGHSINDSGNEVVATYNSVAKDTDRLKDKMLDNIKSHLTDRLESTDWYYLRKLRTGTDVPSDIQDYSDALYAEYESKKTEISAMTKLSQIMEYENRPHTEVRKVQSTDENGKTIYGPKTASTTRKINMINEWPANPTDDVDPAFVSLTAD
jgi:hypothetical protein